MAIPGPHFPIAPGAMRATVPIGELRRDVIACHLQDVVEIDGTRRLANLGLLIAALLVLGLGLLQLDWRTQALLASIVCGLVALVCRLDVLGLAPRTLYRVGLLLSDGRQIDVDLASLDEAGLRTMQPAMAAHPLD